jgi:hypothetical protein
MPTKHRLPVSIEQPVTHDKNVDIAILRKATWKTIRIKAESDLGASDYDHIRFFKFKAWTQVLTKGIEHARILLGYVDIAVVK